MTGFFGAKGGGGGSFKQRPDTLRSTDTFEGLLGLCAGPIKGLTRGLKSLKIDGTPLEDESGKLNFENFVAIFADGNPANFPQKVDLRLGAGGSPVNVNLALSNTNASGPGPWVTRTVNNLGADFLDLRIVCSQLYRQDKKGIYEHSANIEIQLKPIGATNWISPMLGVPSQTYEEAGSTIPMAGGRLLIPRIVFDGGGYYKPETNNGYFRIYGKTSSPAVHELRIVVPNEGAYENVGWDVRCRLIEKESVEADPNFEKRMLTWESVSAGYNTKLGVTEPWRGLSWLQLYGKASDQLTGVPAVEGEYDTLIVPVPPSGVFDPETREYTGEIWDGSWAQAFTTDPAWNINGLISNSTHGMASLSPGAHLNKWDALEASKWFSELVPDGAGGTEPRSSLNIAINEPQKASEFVPYLAGAVGALAWEENGGEWRMKVDKPEVPVDLFTLEAINGEFSYSHTDVDTRFNDITMVFRNKEFGYREDRVRVVDSAHIARFGRKPTTIVAIGCTGRQEALRRAIMRLRVATRETRAVNFTTNRRGRMVRPLSTILIADNDLGTLLDSDENTRATGRIVSIASDRMSITVRDPLRLELGVAYSVSFTVPNPDYAPDADVDPQGENVSLPTVTQTVSITNDAAHRGNVTTIYLSSALPTSVAPNANIALSADGLPALPKQYRVTNMSIDGEMVSISAIEIDTGKWDASDSGVAEEGYVPPIDVVVPPVLNATITTQGFVSDYKQNLALNVNWDRPGAAMLAGYRTEYRVNGAEWVQISALTSLTSIEIINPQFGNWEFRITAVDRMRRTSEPVVVSKVIDEALQPGYYGDGTPVDDLRPAEPGATDGATAGDNLKDSEGNPLGDGDIITSEGISADTFKVGGVLSEDVLGAISTAQTDIDNLIATYGDTASAAASADAAALAAANAQQAEDDAVAARNAAQTAQSDAAANQAAAENAATAAQTSSVTAAVKAATKGMTPNADFSEGVSGWFNAYTANLSDTSPTLMAAATNWNGAANVALNASNARRDMRGSPAQVQAGREYRLRYRFRITAANSTLIGIATKDAAGAHVAFTHLVNANAAALNTWIEGDILIDNATVINGAPQMVPYALTNTGAAVATVAFDYLYVEDVTESENAATSASAASTSASNAAASASDAGDFAASASSSANTATTKAGEASTSAGQAATSASDAEGFKNTASSQATLAAAAKDDAETAASAAASSASVATTKAAEAGNFATSASTAANNASIAKDDAEDAANAAANSATAAAASQTAAGSSASAASEAALTAQINAATRGLTKNGDFSAGLNGWYNYASSSDLDPPPLQTTHEETYEGASGVLVCASDVRRNLMSGRFEIDPTRKYRLRGRIFSSNHGATHYLGIQCRDADDVYLGVKYATVAQALPEGWSDFVSDVITGATATTTVWSAGGFHVGTKRVSMIIFANYSYTVGQILAFDNFYLEDVTESENAAASASAASVSQASAAASESDAEAAASAASGHSNTAQTAAGTATTKASEAATSASNALGSANTASSQATLAANSAAAAETTARQIFRSDFQNGPGYWVAGYAQTKAQLPTYYDVDVGNSAVTIETVTGVGKVLQCSNAYVVMSERSTRPFIDGQKIRVRIRTRLTSDQTTQPHGHYLWVAMLDASGASTGYSAVGVWSGLTVADGWVTREIEFEPTTKRTGANANATEWRLMVGLNGYNTISAAGAVQQIEYITCDDVTESTAAAGSASAAASSASVATTKATEAGNSATSATTAKNEAQAAQANAAASASAAAGSAADADADAAVASTNATLSADYAGAAETAALQTLPSTFEQDGLFFCEGTGAGWLGAPSSLPSASGSGVYSFQTIAGIGRVAVATSTASVQDIAQKGVVAVRPGRKYRVSATHQTSSSTRPMAVYAIALNASYGYIGGSVVTVPATSTTTWQTTSTAVIDGDTLIAAGVVYLRAMGRFNAGTPNGRFSQLKIEDVTESVAAETQAGIATTQAASATSSAASAAANETLTASAKTTMINSLSDLMPKAMNPDLFGGSLAGGVTSAQSALDPSWVPASRAYIDVPSGGYTVSMRAAVPIKDGDVIRLTVDVEQITSATAKTCSSVYLRVLDENFDLITSIVVNPSRINLATGERGAMSVTIGRNNANADYNLTTTGAKYIRPNLLMNRTENGTAQNPGSVARLHAFYGEDVKALSEATSQAGIATSQAAVATAQAAAAQQSAVLSASIGQGFLNKNPGFDDYPSATVGQLPTSWTNWVGSANMYRVNDNVGGYSLRMPGTPGANTGLVFSGHSTTNLVNPGDYFVIEAEITLNSGTLAGAAAYMAISNSAGSAVQSDLRCIFATDPGNNTGAPIGSGEVGKTYKFAKLVKVTAATAHGYFLYAMAHWSTAGSTANANDITWHKCGVRPATPAEIRDQTVLAPMEATVSTQASTLATHTTQLASLDTTVSAQGATISTQQTALNGLATRYSVTLSVNNHITGFSQNNDGTSGDFIVQADKFLVAMPGVTPRVVFGVSAAGALVNGDLYVNNGKIIADTGTYMKVIGKGFGTSNQFIEWFGPKMALNLCSEANAITYTKTNGDSYFGGTLHAGTLKNDGSTSGLGTTEVATCGPFGTNGNPIVVAVSWTYQKTEVKNYTADISGRNAFDADAASYNASDTGGNNWSGTKALTVASSTVTLARKIGGGSFSDVQSASTTSGIGTFTGVRPVVGSSVGTATLVRSYTINFTYTDNAGGTGDRTFTATLARGFTDTLGSSTQRVSIVTTEE
ncbi:TipJ family phage tail tip protein [Sphingopyxis flava]|uniref:Phage-related protein, tail component n=1 Tax=Sphingopyxis flava TaxID=1507287 RepID=A0A1T5CRK8_9SPHN|nr:hypothetical protein [Sphingopyxis flava]SKB62125.1 Phage-related protein, tail component [Sphingopyxis flava]